MRSLGTTGANGRLTLILNHEVGAVETVIRQWASDPQDYQEESGSRSKKYEETFRNLRSEIFKLPDWSTVDPLIYLTPFLELIKSSDVSGPITGAAAVALQRIINSDLLCPENAQVEKAINQVVADATQCKFESTSHANDEIVLLDIVQVLGQAVDCPAGLLLSDETVFKAIQATFMLGDPITKPKEYGDIMDYYSRQICAQMIRTLFRRLGVRAKQERAQAAAAAVHAPPPPSPACKHGEKAASDVLDFLIELIRKDPGVGKEQLEETIVFALDMLHAALMAVGPDIIHFDILVYQIHVDLLHAMCHSAATFASVAIINGFCQVLLCVYTFLGTVSIGQIEVVMNRVLLNLAEGTTSAAPGTPAAASAAALQLAALEGILDMCRQPGFVHDIFANCDCRLERGHLFSDMCSLLSRTATPPSKGPLGPLQTISVQALIAVFKAIAAENRSNAFQPPSKDLELPFFVDIWSPLVQGQLLDLSPLVEAGDAMAVAAGAPTSMQLFKAEPRANGGGEHSSNGTPPGGPAMSDFMRLRSVVYERHLKQKLADAVELFNKNHKKGFKYLQEKKLMPILAGSPQAAGACPQDVASEDELAKCLGRFLHVCPGLDKVAIGELLGEADPFYLKVLEAYTTSFDFHELKFHAAIRLFLESFRLPGEAQKIDRIINSFGHHYYKHNANVFKSADAAYVLAYSIIMLNTDQHNTQVKKKMSLEAFRRNLRGVNENTDFHEDFLNDLFFSIVKQPLCLNEGSSMDVSEQSFVELHQISANPRGQMIHSDPGRHLFDTTMFRLMWKTSVTAVCRAFEVANDKLVDEALEGLEEAAHIAACHQLDDVSDTIILNLTKLPQQVTDSVSRPESVLAKDAKLRKSIQTIAKVATHHGDSLRKGWGPIMDLLVGFYKQQLLPDGFVKALAGDGKGGLVSKDVALRTPKERRAIAKKQAAAEASYFQQLSTMLMVVEAEYPERSGSMTERIVATAVDESLAKCCWEDLFNDSKFLKQESLVCLVDAILHASGQIPRPGPAGATMAGWDVTELCLELLFTVLLRNRDRIGLLWPKVLDHFQKIYVNSKNMDLTLVRKAVMAMMRMCQRLLPYKTDMCELLLKGVEQMSLVDSQVVVAMAPTIAEEILNLLEGAAPFIQDQAVWLTLTNLLHEARSNSVAFPMCVATVSCMAKDCLSRVNFKLVLTCVVDMLEQAVPPVEVAMGLKAAAAAGGGGSTTLGHPDSIPELLGLIVECEEWLSTWSSRVAQGMQKDAVEPGFEQESWYHVVSMLCRAMKSSSFQVRSASCKDLQRSVVMAQKLSIPGEMMQRALLKLILPMASTLAKVSGAGGQVSLECPQADITARELVCAILKVVLLYTNQLQQLPNFGTVWRRILECMATIMDVASSSDALLDAVPEAMQNMLLLLEDKGVLREGWVDDDGTDLWELSWKCAGQISATLSPAMLTGE